MSDTDLDEIEARANAATEGPWNTGWDDGPTVDTGDDTQTICDVYSDPDDGPYSNAEFIAHARTDIPALVAEVRRLRDARNEYKFMWESAVEEANRDVDKLRATVERVEGLYRRWAALEGVNLDFAYGVMALDRALHPEET